jgi:Tol biopolymer transport system component
MYQYWRLLIFMSLALVIAGLGLAACAAVPAQKPSTEPVQAPVPTVTMAPALTITLSPIKKPLASASPTIMPMPTLQPLLKGPLTAFIASDAAGNGYILILDVTTDSIRRFQWIGNIPGMAEWWPDGCGLNVTLMTSSGVELVSTDLQNNTLSKVYGGGKRTDGSYATWPILSPNKKWVAYTVLSGQQQYIGAEFQNIEVIAVGNQDRPLVLTKHGGAWKAAWSPSGEYLTYSDYDAAGVAQLYRSRPSGSERVQLTHFKVDGMTIGPARWSPQNDKIIIATYESDGTGSVWIIFADGSKQVKVKAEGTILKTDDFWWSEDGQLVAFYAPKNSKQGTQYDAVYWINAANGTVKHALQSSALPGGYISQPFPIGGLKVIGFVRHDGFLYYDLASDTLSKKEYSDIELDDLTGPVIAAPASFRGEASCRNQ